ncbi:DUF4386 family protein [Pseudonocardia hierapolitana]|uniref:DUF4386 family protein n=1 Tax=Pseudonocardia hierapolitana TaxID=1128676 RepID=UPI003CCC7DF7
MGSALVAFHNWTFLVGPSLVLGTSTVLLAYLLYRSGLVPRFIPVLGPVFAGHRPDVRPLRADLGVGHRHPCPGVRDSDILCGDVGDR